MFIHDVQLAHKGQGGVPIGFGHMEQLSERLPLTTPLTAKCYYNPFRPLYRPLYVISSMIEQARPQSQ